MMMATDSHTRLICYSSWSKLHSMRQKNKKTRSWLNYWHSRPEGSGALAFFLFFDDGCSHLVYALDHDLAQHYIGYVAHLPTWWGLFNRCQVLCEKGIDDRRRRPRLIWLRHQIESSAPRDDVEGQSIASSSRESVQLLFYIWQFFFSSTMDPTPVLTWCLPVTKRPL